jgi:hypothetical protein
MAQILWRHSNSRQFAACSPKPRATESAFAVCLICAWFVFIRGRFPQDPNRMSKIPTAAPKLVCILVSEIGACSECWESAQRSRLSRRYQLEGVL